jgi:uncharacterized protein
VNDSRNLLRLNVGFIIHETVGFSREFEINADQIHLNPDLDLENLDGRVQITRMAHGLLLQAQMVAITNIDCVRCLDPFSRKLEIDFSDLYTFVQNMEESSDLIVPEDGVLDLAPSIREEFLLAVPINPICSIDCKGLCPVCGENQNFEYCEHEPEVIDPRMQVLKSLLEEE